MLSRSVAALAIVFCAAAIAQPIDPTPKLVAPEKLASYWTMIGSSVEADVPNIAKNIQQPGCATVSFVVGADGNTSEIKVQKVVPDGDFRKIAAGMAKSVHFEPTAFNAGRTRVFSWLIFPFNLPADPAARSAVMQRCAIAKLDWKDH